MNTPTPTPTPTQEAFERLYQTIIRLRGKGGCPWDIEQTPLTLRETLIEESYETVEAITEGDSSHVCEEAGDVFLNATMLAYMYEQEGIFSVADSLNQVSDKLIRRHPHVFGQTEGFPGPEQNERTRTAEKVLAQWDQIKRGIEGRKTESILDEVSRGIPALERATKLQKKASKKGFDWVSVEDVLAKVEEELNEVREALKGGNQSEIESEIGDLLFAVVNLARHVKVDPGVSLTRTNAKFIKRFKYVETSMSQNDIPMDKEHLSIMDAFWNEAKLLP